jgi:CRISPR/Cas system-associated protein endoribonuclease Cas2
MNAFQRVVFSVYSTPVRLSQHGFLLPKGYVLFSYFSLFRRLIHFRFFRRRRAKRRREIREPNGLALLLYTTSLQHNRIHLFRLLII